MNTKGQPAFRILHAPPVNGAREPICRADEAIVSRMLSPKRYAGMVERLQKTPLESKEPEASFVLSLGARSKGLYFDPSEKHNHALRFLALGFARSVFPDNFIDASELRLSTEQGHMSAAMYSVHVPDENGVMARRGQSAGRFYACDGAETRQKVRVENDLAEQALNPLLARDVRNLSAAGIEIPHPEANYHQCGGVNVFFEVSGIDLEKAFAAAMEFSPDSGLSIDLLSMVCLAAQRGIAQRRLSYAKEDCRRYGAALSHDIADIYCGVRYLLSNSAWFPEWALDVFFEGEVSAVLDYSRMSGNAPLPVYIGGGLL